MNTVADRRDIVDWSAAGRPLTGQELSGDMHVVELAERGGLLAVIDGVGHGVEAHAVAGIAADILKSGPSDSVIPLIKQCHEALARTRGVVMSLAYVDALEDTVTWAGVGNVEGRLFRAEADTSHPCENIMLRGGLVGLQLPALRASILPLAPGDLLVFATDGIQTGFEAGINFTETPRQIADGILRRHFKGTDDALVLVVRYNGFLS